MRRKIYRMVPDAYQPILRQTFKDCEKAAVIVKQRVALREMARNDHLKCIKFHEKHNGWNLAFGLTEDALSGGASVETIVYLQQKDFALSMYDLGDLIVKYNRPDVFKAMQKLPFNLSGLLFVAFEYNQTWVLDWFMQNQKRSTFLIKNWADRLENVFYYIEDEIHLDVLRWIADRELDIPISIRTMIIRQLVWWLCWREAKEKIKIRALYDRFQLYGSRCIKIRKELCDELCRYSDAYDPTYLKGIACDCDYPERH